jgi:hypothetical protein
MTTMSVKNKQLISYSFVTQTQLTIDFFMTTMLVENEQLIIYSFATEKQLTVNFLWLLH